MTHRVQRVRELIRRELSMVLEKDFSFPHALITVHDVQMPPDLRQCFVYVGVIGTGIDKERVLSKLNASRGTLQRSLYKRVILRNSPTLEFRMDDSIERGVRVLNIIENLPPFAPDEVVDEEAGKE